MSNNFGPCILDQEDPHKVDSLRFYLARRTVLEMLGDRGYTCTPDTKIPASLDDFRAVFGNISAPEDLGFLAYRISNPRRKIQVIFCGDLEIRKANAVGILTDQVMDKDSLDRVILVLRGGINSHAKKLMADYSVKVETFKITDLLVNITKHVLMPKYEFLSPEEKEVVLKKFSIQDNQFPKMLQNDAIARYYALEKGQVVKITYGNDTTGTLVTYRCVV